MMKDIKGYNGYKINENGVVINKKGHIMRQALSNVGRPRIPLEVYDENGNFVRRDNKSVSRLVAETFIPNPNNLPVVMHLDNDVLHNHVSNLKWGTQSENIQQAFNEGRKNQPRCIYEVYNEDRSEVIKCKGIEGVSELIGLSEKSVKLGEIKSGEYKGYTVENTNQKAIFPISFRNINHVTLLPQYIE